MSRASGSTPHLLDEWDRVAKRIRESKQQVIFLDFDGTLVRIARVPDRVRLAARARRVLQKLAARPEVTIAVISGRRRAELQHFIAISTIKYFGLYGWERNGSARPSATALAALARARKILSPKLPAYPGVWIEPKGMSFSIHLLDASAASQRRARRMVKTSLSPLQGSLRVLSNLRDIEVVPASMGDKGEAVRRILRERRLAGALPLYFGDDMSDEPAFIALRNGITILVGNRRATRAHFFLSGPAEVATALSRMEAIL
jgi:trehalose 6-phosphate phosphatase